METVIIWFRNDLRLHDHEALFTASKRTNRIIPVYVIEPHWFEETKFGFKKTGYFRAKFLLESLANLKSNLKKLGSDLFVKIGNTSEELAKIANQTNATAVYASKEITQEEVSLEKAVEKALFAQKVGLELFWQSTLFHLEDLPMPLGNLPDIFTQFRKKVEKLSEIRKTFPEPTNLLPLGFEVPELPTLTDLGFAQSEVKDFDQRSVLPFEGGESAGKNRLHHYFWETDSLQEYKETRNGLLGADYSSKFSPWLSLGCLSPRYVYEEVKRYEKQRVKNQSTYWLIFELIWRDYFKFVAKKYGNAIFQIEGTKGESLKYHENWSLFERWINGETGVPFIDANMKELKYTGFMSNRGRQNVASFLVKDLNLNWIWGAAYFESALIDYDVCSNWCNWNYVAGVGNDPRENRYFNILSQAKRYDSKGEYVKCWLADLKNVPSQLVHKAGDLGKKEREEFQMNGFPQAVVSSKKWEKRN